MRLSVIAGEDAGQEALLLGRVTEAHDHRAHHLETEGQQPWGAGRRALLLEDVLLHGIPAGAAELLGPVRAAPTLLMQDLLPAQGVVARDLQAFEYLAAHVGRNVRRDERSDLVAEGQLLGAETQVHGSRVLLASLVFAMRNYVSCHAPGVTRPKSPWQARPIASS